MPSRSASSAMVANSPDSSMRFQRNARTSALTSELSVLRGGAAIAAQIADPDAQYRQSVGKVAAGQSLVIFNRGYLTPVDPEVLENDEGRAVAALVALNHATAEEQVTAVIEELTAHAQADRAVIVARRIY